MDKIQDSVIRHISENSWSENDIYKMLGKACKDVSYIQYYKSSFPDMLCEAEPEKEFPERKPKYYYQLKGLALWKKIEPEIYRFFCCDKKPREWVEELITGDIRNMAVGIISALTAKYNIAMGIAVPIAALVIKKQMVRFCKLDIPYPGQELNIKELFKNEDENI